MMSQKKVYFLAILVVVIWGTLSTVYKILVGSLDAMFVLAFSSLLSTAALFFYNLLKGNFKYFKELKFKDVFMMVILGLIGYFFYNWFYLKGMSLLPSQQAMTINYLWPAMIILFSCLILKERMTRFKLIAVICSVIGVFIVITGGNLGGFQNASRLGIFFSFLAAVSYGLYSAWNKKQTYQKELGVFVFYLTTTVVAGVIVLARGELPHISMPVFLGMAYNGFIVCAFAYTAWTVALDHGNTAIISSLAFFCPFLSLVTAWIVLKEKITVFSILGVAFIVGGVFLQMAGERMEAKKTEKEHMN